MKDKFVDLTFTIREGMLTFPSYWHSSVKITQLGRLKSEGRETRGLVMGTHTGTHLDAPRHFIAGGRSVDRISLEACIGPAILIAFYGKANRSISLEEIKKGLAGFDKIERLILKFGWSRHWGKKRYYDGYPYLSEGACRWLVKNGLKFLGMDTPSSDDSKNNRHSKNDSPNHKYLLRRGVVLAEYLCNLDKLKGPKIFLIALPLKIKDADGSPARIVAYEIQSRQRRWRI